MSPVEPNPVDFRGKRVLDLAVAATALIFLWPVMIVASMAVRASSSGPVLYRARRVGRDGHEFDAFKFRSMYTGAAGPAITAAQDHRVTRVGKVLRKTKIDELPQLFNVVRGEMSIVGPRPEDPRYVSGYDDDQRQILRWRPGITSPASLAFRHEESILNGSDDLESTYAGIMNRKIEIDLAYLRGASVIGDLRVMVGTARAIVSRPTLDEMSTEGHSTPNMGSCR